MKKAIIFYKGEQVCEINFDKLLSHEQFGLKFLNFKGEVVGQFSWEYAYIVLQNNQVIK
jgi:hypothetical protein